MRFGDYLIEKGVVSKEALDMALKFQTEKSLRLGALAVEDGLLTEQQLSVILDRQREVEAAGLFGEIAINMKLLNKEQVHKLLEKQKENDKITGQILVLSGALSKNEKENELKLFYGMMTKKD